MHPKDLSIEDFSYVLPKEKIALYAAEPRDSSRLLIYDEGLIKEDIYRNLEHHLPKNSVLVFNDTRVIKSRLLFPKSTGAIIEIFCLEPYEDFRGYDLFFRQTGKALWKCMIGKAGKWKEKRLSKTLSISGTEVTLTAELQKKLTDSYLVELSWTPPAISHGEIMDAAGVTPLPPYIKRKANKKDETSYQTIYSAHEGSVAAPTAGLHFTDKMMKGFQRKGIETLFTTLHVGAGTFKPVKSDFMEGHIMHKEWMNITVEFLENLLKNIDKSIITVGTTATRTLESIYWMGNKIISDKVNDIHDLQTSQWEVYDLQEIHSPEEATAALIHWIKSRGKSHLMIETGILIAPGYDYKIINGLITNFHQPQSTLLLLVAALMGEEWRKVYDYALQHNFRFLSYGDGCLILPRKETPRLLQITSF